MRRKPLAAMTALGALAFFSIFPASAISPSLAKGLFLLAAVPHASTVTTFVGSKQGYEDGTGASAQLNGPNGLVFDRQGNMFVADSGNYCIRKVTPAGVVTTFAGDPAFGTKDGHGTDARFNGFGGITIDRQDNLYVTDSCQIRKISPSGDVTTLVGDAAGFADGPKAGAMFRSPRGIVADAAGALYVCDSSNARIRKVTPDGTVSTLAGGESGGFANGRGDAAKFAGLQDITIDAKGTLFVTDGRNSRVRTVTPEGTVGTLAGNGSWGYHNGNPKTAEFNGLHGIVVDKAGNVYVADSDNHRIRLIGLDGRVSSFAGSGSSGSAEGVANTAEFHNPEGLAMGPDGTLFVADRENHRIRQIR
jgi:sugar lactone lactonase YvrE